MDNYNVFQDGEHLEGIEPQLMTLDSKFQFECNKCGKCCQCQTSVFLTSRDLFNIAKKLGKAPQTIVAKYAEILIGHESQIPLVHMVPRGSACPFLEDGRCSVNDSKPVACALFPLGQVVVMDMDSSRPSSEGITSIRYILNDIPCSSRGNTHTVREWIAHANVLENDEFLLLWSDIIITVSNTINRIMSYHVSDDLLQAVWNTFSMMLYMDYDISKDFLPQFQQMCKRISILCRGIDGVGRIVYGE